MMHIMKRMIPKVFGYDNKEVIQIDILTLGHCFSLNNEPNESHKIHPGYNWFLHYPMNEMK